MKLKFLLLPTLAMVTLPFACKKETTPGPQLLYGTWKLTEVYDRYGSAGQDQWHDVATEEIQYIEFTAGGQYQKTLGLPGSLQQCSGTYRWLPSNKIEVKAPCEPTGEQMTITKLTAENLILDRLGTEGVIRYKYSAQK